jgi:signal transduction histidine kinase
MVLPKEKGLVAVTMKQPKIAASSSGSVGSASSSGIASTSTISSEQLLTSVHAPAACPFSGVAIDPALWEAFQASLASNHHHGQPPYSRSLSDSAPSSQAADGARQQAPRLLRLTTKANNSLRVRVTNQTTKRFKDLVLNRADNDSLFSAIYENPAVKEAHIRKWGTKIAQDVKKGLAEINVRMIVGDEGTDEQVDKLLSVEELKQITTKDLFESAEEHQRMDSLIEFRLVCVTKEEALSEGGALVDSLIVAPVAATSHAPAASVVVTEATAAPLTASVPDLESPSDVANRSKPTSTPPPNMHKADSTHLSAVNVNARMLAVRTQSSGSEMTGSSIHLNSDMEGRFECVKRSHFQGSSSTPHPAKDIVASRVNPISAGSSSAFDSTLSGNISMSMMDLDLLSEAPTLNGEHTQQQHPQNPLVPLNNKDKPKSTLGVSVINQTTKRSKDLVVDINDTDTIFDAVYDHDAVKAAHVRKWGGPIAKAVKNGTSEIKCSVWDEDTGRPWRVFSINELKVTTTRQLYELVSESSNLVKIHLECCPVNNDNNISVNINATTIAPLASQARGPKMFKMRAPPIMPQTSLKLEKHGRPQFSIDSLSHHSSGNSTSKTNIASKHAAVKESTRPNHMKLSSSVAGYDSCPSKMANYLKGNTMLRRSHTETPEPGRRELREHRRRELPEPGRRELMRKISSGSLNLDQSLKDIPHAKRHHSDLNGKRNASWVSQRPHPTSSTGDPIRRGKRLIRSTSLGRTTRPILETNLAPPMLSRFRSDTFTEKNRASHDEDKEKMKQFMRLLRGKMLPEFQSQRPLGRGKVASVLEEETPKAPSPAVPLVVQPNERRGNLLNNVSSLSLSLQGGQLSSMTGGSSTTFSATARQPDDAMYHFLPSKASHQTVCSTLNGNSPKTNDKITRFLALQNECIASSRGTGMDLSLGASRTSRALSRKKMSRLADAGKQSIASSDIPPIKEISVFANEDASVASTPPGVSLSADLVKDIFPYHVAIDADFRITQVGKSLEMFIQESSIVGRRVFDVLTVTSPLPMNGTWDWTIMEKMKDKTIFLETIAGPALDEQVRLKGTLVEVCKSPKQVMLVLFPNVKNLAELEEANLSMADLPLHSCQREAVLFGEHSKSEVKLTNHLDKLHRDLIGSMEQQIKDRTEELAEANLDLERANALLAIQSARQLEHFACMSHEIRTPLNCIVGMSSLLLDDADVLDPMHADSIRMIYTSGDLLKAVVDDVLDYAKLESGSFEVDIKEINLQHTLSSVVHSISQKVQEKNIRMRLHYSPLLPATFETDSRRLQQVLFNLLGNAGKFSKENSVIDFQVSIIPAASTEVNPDDTSNGEVVRFSVKDYGKGIEKKDFKTIFDPFSQASKETQTIYGGTGLGLSITSKLVKRLGGAIGVQSEYGKFAEFTVDLPFRGKTVNTVKLRKTMRNTVIVIVEPKKHYNYGFCNDVSQEEPSAFHEAESEAFGLRVIRCHNLDCFFHQLKTSDMVTPDTHFALLVREDLYQFGTIEMLESLVHRMNYTLMTFGPKYAVETTKDRHFKSLEGIFPASLLESIAEHIDRSKHEKIFYRRFDAGVISAQSAKYMFDEITDAKSLFAELESGTASDESKAEFYNRADDSVWPTAAGKRDTSSSAVKVPSTGLVAIKSTTAPSTTLNSSSGGLFETVKDTLTATKDMSKTFAVDEQDTRASYDPGPRPPGQLAVLDNKTTAEADCESQPVLPKISVPTQVQPKQSTAMGAGRNHRTPASRNRSIRVLYAEDNVVNQKVLLRVLQRSGISDITVVDNGKKAVDICETEKYDCIFSKSLSSCTHTVNEPLNKS